MKKNIFIVVPEGVHRQGSSSVYPDYVTDVSREGNQLIKKLMTLVNDSEEESGLIIVSSNWSARKNSDESRMYRSNIDLRLHFSDLDEKWKVVSGTASVCVYKHMWKQMYPDIWNDREHCEIQLLGPVARAMQIRGMVTLMGFHASYIA